MPPWEVSELYCPPDGDRAHPIEIDRSASGSADRDDFDDVLLAGCGGSTIDSAVVDRTTPQTTVASYLQALGAGRGDLASTMLSPEARADGLDASWRADAPDLTNVAVGAPRDVGGELPYWESQYAEVQEVQVSFFLADSSGKDGFFGGDTWWGYRVVRSPADQPWMI